MAKIVVNSQFVPASLRVGCQRYSKSSET